MSVADEAVIEPFGDAALLVTIGSGVDPLLAARAQAIAAAIDDARVATPGIGRPVPAHASVLVPIDPLVITLDEALGIVRRAVAAAGPASKAPSPSRPAPGPIVEIPVRYGGADGPDLDVVAAILGLTPGRVIELHAAARFEVRFLGFAPGFAYLGGLPTELAVARRATPRERVPAGSVAIAGGQSAVYPLPMPGGWQLIGRTDLLLFDPGRPDPALLRPGASVRFVPVTDP